MQNSTISAFSMIRSFGANTHIDQGPPVYSDPNVMLKGLSYLGIADIRDGALSDPAFLKILTDQGVRIDAVFRQSISDTINGALAIAGLGPNALRYVEGPNEINLNAVTYNGQTTSMSSTFLPAAQAQTDLYGRVKASAVLRATPVVDLTSGGAEPDNVGLQYLAVPSGANTLMPDGTVFADLANIHAYPSNGNQPASSTDDRLSNELAAQYGQTWGSSYNGYTQAQLSSLPKVVTEFGFATTGIGGGSDSIDEATQAKHGLNMMFDAVQRGYSMSYFYELADNNTQSGDEAHYGLFHSDYSPKPIATGIHNLSVILADTGAGAASAKGSLNYTIPGMPGTASSLLMAKSNGALDLAVWNEPTDWDPANQQEISTSPVRLTVGLGNVYSHVEVFDPLRGASAIQTLTNVSGVSLSLNDGPLIVQVDPPSSAPPTPSPDRTEITRATDAAIIDNHGNSWTLVQSASQGLQIAVNGAVDQQTANVTLLETLKGNMVQENVVKNWYSEPGPGGPWTQIPSPTIIPPDVLTLHLSEDAYKGNAQFIAKLDGKQIAGPTAVTALHQLGQWQDFAYQGTWGSGLHKVEVDFTNDAFGGKPSLDRNLYVAPPTFDGLTAAGSQTALYSNNAAIFTVGHS